MIGQQRARGLRLRVLRARRAVVFQQRAGVSVDGYTLTLAANPWNIVRTYNLTGGAGGVLGEQGPMPDLITDETSLEHDSPFVFAIRIVFRQLVILLDADVKNPTNMDLLPFLACLGRNIMPFLDSRQVPASLRC